MSKSWKTNLFLLCVFLTEILVPLVFGNQLRSLIDGDFNKSTVVSEMLIFLPVCLYFGLTRENPIRLCSIRPVNPLVFLLIPVLYICLMPWVTVANILSQFFTTNVVTTNGTASGMFSGSFWGQIIFVGMLPALVEELAMRGVVLGGYRKAGLGAWGCVILSSLAFGFMHLNLNQFVYASVMGIFLSLLVLATRSIFTSMFTHFLANSLTVVMMNLLQFLGGTSMGKQAVEIASQGISKSQLLFTGCIYLVLALILSVPAVFIFMAIVKLCHTEDVIYPMFSPRYRRMQKEKESGELPENSETKKRSRVLDVFFVMALIVPLVYIVIDML